MIGLLILVLWNLPEAAVLAGMGGRALGLAAATSRWQPVPR